MGPKRFNDDEQQQIMGAAALQPGTEASRLAAMTKSSQPEKPEEKISIFWRVFGGTILSIVALVLITLYNGVNNSINEVRSASNALATELRGDVTRINEARVEYVKKDDVQTRLSTAYQRIQDLQTKLEAANVAVNGFKEQLATSSEKQSTARKELREADEAAKTATAGLRDRVNALETMCKAAEVDRKAVATAQETAAGLANKLAAREDQLKRFEESYKESQRDVTALRERLVKLEAQSEVRPAAGVNAIPTSSRPAESKTPSSKPPAKTPSRPVFVGPPAPGRDD